MCMSVSTRWGDSAAVPRGLDIWPVVQLLAATGSEGEGAAWLAHSLEHLRRCACSQVPHYCVAPLCEVLAIEHALLQLPPALHSDNALL